MKLVHSEERLSQQSIYRGTLEIALSSRHLEVARMLNRRKVVTPLNLAKWYLRTRMNWNKYLGATQLDDELLVLLKFAQHIAVRFSSMFDIPFIFCCFLTEACSKSMRWCP